MDRELSAFLNEFPDLHLGGQDDFRNERRKYLEVFGIHKLPKDKVHPIQEVGFTAIRGPHGTIPIRVLYPISDEDNRKFNKAGGLIYSTVEDPPSV